MKTLMLLTLIFSFQLANASDFLAIEGRLTDSTGLIPVTSTSVSFDLEVLSPGAEQCVLYRETHGPINMSSSNGYFNLRLGKGSIVSGVFINAFNNSAGTQSGLSCASGTTYTPAQGQSRRLRISYNSGAGVQTLTQLIEIGASQYAQYAYTLQGLMPSQLVRINNSTAVLSQANLETIFNNAASVTELRNLIDGTSSLYNTGLPTANVNTNNQRIVNVATPVNTTDAANKNYVDQNVGGRLADAVTLAGLSAGQAGHQMTWDGTQWTATAPSADNTKLPLAGGTMAGAINMGGFDVNGVGVLNATGNSTFGANVTVNGGIGVTTGINSGGAINIQGGNSLQLSDADNSNSLSLRSPSTVVSDVTFILPDNSGTSGQVLQTDGTGVLSWATASGEVNTASNLGATGVGVFISKSSSNLGFRNIADASPKIIVTDDFINNEIDIDVNETALNSSLIPIVPNGNISATNIQNAIEELDAEKLSLSGGTLSGILLLENQQSLAFGELNANGTNRVRFRAPANLAADSDYVLPGTMGASGAILTTDGTGNLNWDNPLVNYLRMDGSFPMTGNLRVVPGTLVAPGVSFTSDSASGLHSPGTGSLDLVSGGQSALHIDGGARNVGIGIVTPITKLDVAGGVRVGMEAATCSTPLYGTIRYNNGTNSYDVCVSGIWKRIAFQKECGADYAVGEGSARFCITSVSAPPTNAVSACRTNNANYPGRICTGAEAKAAMDLGFSAPSTIMTADVYYAGSPPGNYMQISNTAPYGVVTTTPIGSATAVDVACCY